MSRKFEYLQFDGSWGDYCTSGQWDIKKDAEAKQKACGGVLITDSNGSYIIRRRKAFVGATGRRG